MGVNDLSNEDFERLYGRWATRTPADVAVLFAGYPGTWWVAGGWAIEAFTCVPRKHEDIDVSVRDGVRYLAPEIQLLYKAEGLRPKDQADFDATVPLLNDRDRRWLRGALEQTLPDHPWIAAL